MKPPAGIAPATFFATWLPEAYKTSGRRAPDDAPTVRTTLSGTNGGTWEIRATSEGLQTEAVTELSRQREWSHVDIWVRLSVDDFHSAFDGGPDLPNLLPPGFTALDLLFLDERDVTLARQIQGRFVVEVNGRRKRRWALDVAIGKTGLAAGRARATVKLDGTTYGDLASGAIAPLEALLKGRIGIDGDRALCMQAMLLLGSRLSRGPS